MHPLEINGGLDVIQRAWRLAAVPVLISLVVTPVRLFLELAGLPAEVIFIVGLLWLTLGVAFYWGMELSSEPHPYQLLFLGLVIFSPISRFPVFVVWWISETLELGTHYEIFDNWIQALVGQLFWGSLVQIIPGTVVGFLTLAFVRWRRPVAA
jgi:hypothetical protein